MIEVARYKCKYCDKLAVKPKTILRHEAVCMKNPNGRNCYMCEMAYMGDYEYDDGYLGGTIKDQCMCIYTEDVVSAVLGGGEGNYAPKCSMFHRAKEGYWCRDYEDAEKNLEMLRGEGFANNERDKVMGQN